MLRGVLAVTLSPTMFMRVVEALLIESRVFSFEKPQGESIYTLTVYGGLFNSTAYGFQIIECPSC